MSHSHEFSSKTKRLLLAFPLWITAWHVSPKTPAFQDRSCEAPGQRQIASRFIIHHPIYGRVSFEKSMKLSQKIHEFLLPTTRCNFGGINGINSQLSLPLLVGTKSLSQCTEHHLSVASPRKSPDEMARRAAVTHNAGEL